MVYYNVQLNEGRAALGFLMRELVAGAMIITLHFQHCIKRR
jgi:hypothetical protein